MGAWTAEIPRQRRPGHAHAPHHPGHRRPRRRARHAGRRARRRGQSAHYLTTLKAPAAAPVAIHGTEAKAFLKTGQRLHRGQSLMRVRVNGPAHSGSQLRFTCPSGAVTGYGYKGADALAINGKRILSQHTIRPKVQAASDLNHDGGFTGTVYAFCEGGH